MTVKDTIVAIATASGNAGIGIVRISGSEALAIANKITKKELKPRFATFSNIYDSTNEIIDNAIVIYFKAPLYFLSSPFFGKTNKLAFAPDNRLFFKS